MRLLSPIAGLLVALTVAVPTSADPSTVGEIAFVNDTGLYEVDADGTSAVLIRPSGGLLRQPRWSPDGTQVAFVNSPSPAETRIFVINANGGDERLLAVTPTPPDPHFALSRQTWAPDGQSITFGPAPAVDWGDIYTKPITGGLDNNVRRTFDTFPKQPAVWSPDGSTLAYSRHVQSVRYVSELFALPLNGGSERRLTVSFPGPSTNESPAWSPDGSLIAWSRAYGDQRGIYVIRPDGTFMRRVSSVPGTAPAWSPDGQKLAFTSPHGTSSDIYVVDLDGSNERRVTDAPVEGVRNDDVSWAPSGRRLLFTRTGEQPQPVLYTINPDGTCERRLVESMYGWDGMWRPGSSGVAGQSCRMMRGDVTTALNRQGSVGTLRLAVRNTGTEPVDRVRVQVPAASNVSVLSATSELGSCVVTSGAMCSLGTVPPRSRVEVVLRIEARRLVGASPTYVAVRIVAEGLDRPDVHVAELAFATCGTAVRTATRVLGTSGNDQLCGGSRRDRLVGGPGNDRLRGGAGRDVLLSGSGRDAVKARDGERDLVSCGAGRDTVVADRRDSVARDCERVSRP